MKKFMSVLLVMGLLGLVSCGSSSSGSGASTYATFGQTVNDTVPAGLKSGAAATSVSALPSMILDKTLSGPCATDYTDCPYITATGGGDPTAGEILMRLWALDYDNECTSSLITAGTCFECADCSNSYKYIKPLMLSNPTSCYSANTTTAEYVNFGMDPCRFDSIINEISNIAACETTQGGAVDISTAVPWYSSWGLSQTVNFSSYYARDNGGNVWWTINNGANGNQQYFLSLDSNWMYMGFKDPTNNKFMFFGTGSPAYFTAEAARDGYTTGVNIAGYAGTLTGIPAQFEAIQVRNQSPHTYIERLKSNGSYVWYQNWDANKYPTTPSAVAGVKDSPSENRCVQIGNSVVQSKYVPLADCVTSFGKTDVSDLNKDDNFMMKIIDGQTANAIQFTTSLTPTKTSTSCLPVETAE